MAARIKPVLRQDHRDSIQTSMLIKRLHNHAVDDKYELSPSRIKAIEILLKKTIPDLKQVEHSGEMSVQISKVEIEYIKAQD